MSDAPLDVQPQAAPAPPSPPPAPDPSPEPASPEVPSRPFSLTRGLGIEDATPPDGEPSATAAESKPSDTPRPSRRETARETNLRRIAELEQEVQSLRQRETSGSTPDEAAVAAARADERERIAREADQAERARSQQQAADAERRDAALFTQACRMADTDPRLRELVPGDPQQRTLYNWREDRKELEALVSRSPEAEAAIRADARYEAEQQLEQARAEAGAERARLAREIQRATSLPHVKPEDLSSRAPEPLDTWDKMAGYFHQAGASWKAAELEPKLAERDETIAARDATIAALQQSINDLKLVGPRGLGSGRAPVAPGQPASSARTSGWDPRRDWRENFAAAINADANGR